MQRLLVSLSLACAAPMAIAQCVAAGPGATSYGSGDDVVVNGGAGIEELRYHFNVAIEGRNPKAVTTS